MVENQKQRQGRKENISGKAEEQLKSRTCRDKVFTVKPLQREK